MHLNVRALIQMALMAALTAVGAFLTVRIPLFDVALSLQILFVLLAGLLLPPWQAALSMTAYVALGLLGLPIFALGGGFGYVLQPTFGFVLAFIPTAGIVSLLYRRLDKLVPRPILRAAAACMAGMLCTYLLGVPYLYWILNAFLAKPITLSQALISGCIMYLPYDAVKVLLVSVVSVPIAKGVRALQGIQG